VGPKRFPLAVSVEKGAVKNVITERGSTRIVAIGDSIMFANKFIEADANKDFLSASINWLLERPGLTQGVAPKPVGIYHIALTAGQISSASWLMLAAIPGAVLLFGGLVWLRRRK
jgi:LPXTG-motif cell wall-anchored protein